MLCIRFLRTGKKNQPFFRIVVCDKKNPPRGGRFLEIVGSFNPHTKEKQLKADRIKYWLSKGAQPSDRVHNILAGEGIIKDKKKPVHSKSKKKKEGEPVEPTAAKQEETAAPKQAEAPAKAQDAPAKQPAPEEPAQKPAEPKQEEKQETNE